MINKPLVIKAAAGADRGRVRHLNEDAVLAYVRPPDYGLPLALLIVADGMGGHQAGEVASRLTIETMREQLSWLLEEDDSQKTQLSAPAADPKTDTAPGPTAQLQERLRLAVEAANTAIYQYSLENPVEAGNMGCTVTCALIHNDLAIIGNVGDSRAYLWRDGALQQITEDHSYVWEMIQAGQLPPEAVYDHPQRNVVTRALGSQNSIEVDFWAHPLQPHDRLLLCSDGLWEMVRDEERLAQLISEDKEPPEIVAGLIELANAYGGGDNIGVVVARIE